MKPSWDTAPDWAGWLCMNRYGQWYWCEDQPIAGEVGYDFSAGRRTMIDDVDRPLVFRENWKTTIEARP